MTGFNLHLLGKGCILLLHGEPGVGKTSTAGQSHRKLPGLTPTTKPVTDLYRMRGIVHEAAAIPHNLR